MVRLSFAVTASILVFWISAMGSSNYLLYTWRSGTKALSPQVFSLMLWSRGWQVRRQETLRAAGIAQAEQAEEQVPTGAVSNVLEEQASVGVMSSVLEAGREDTAYREAQYRKRALALRRASGTAARVLVAPEDVSAKDILPEDHNGFTSMVAISCVLVFATFVAF